MSGESLPKAEGVKDTEGKDLDECQPIVIFGLVDGVAIRKTRLTIDIYPDIAELVKHVISVIERAYESGIRREMEEYGASSEDNTSPDPPCSPEY